MMGFGGVPFSGFSYKGRDFARKDERRELGRCTFPVKNVYKKGKRLDHPPPLPPEG